MTDTSDTDDAAKTGRGRATRRLLWLFFAFPVAVVAAGFGVRSLHLGWIGTLLFMVLVAIAMIVLMLAAQARINALGCSSPAQNRYNLRMMVAGVAYMFTFLFATFAYRRLHVEGAWMWLAAAAPTLSVVAMIWAMARLMIEETDEYLRFRMAVQGLAGTAGLLTLATVWGFLEQFGLVPHAPGWLAVPVFALCSGLFALLRKARS
jgi:hypothetical protein